MIQRNKVVLSPVKWVGSKRKLAATILDHVITPTTLVESFGGGLHFTAAFADRFPDVPVVVSDALETMIAMWHHLRSPDVRRLIRDYATEYESRNVEDRKLYYYELREQYTALAMRRKLSSKSDPVVEMCMSAMLFVMMRTCYNGLYRTSRTTGIYNTSAGHYAQKRIYNEQQLVDFLEVSKKWRITARDYRESLADVIEGCFVYLDPPYKDTYDGYCGKDGFDQRGLAPFIRECMKRGARQVFMSQSYDPEFWADELPEAKQLILERREIINSDTDGRGVAKELLLMVHRLEQGRS